MKDDQEQLREITGDDHACNDPDSDPEALVLLADPIVERKTGQAADNKGRCVDDVRDEVEDLGLQNLIDGEHVFDVFEVSA